MTKEDLMEQMANLEHNRWSNWMKYMWGRYDREHNERWRRQSRMSYYHLAEVEKESDRKEVRKQLELLAKAPLKVVEELLKDYR